MDFAALMNKELSKSKKKSTSDNKKYLKRSEIEAQRQEAYATEQKALQESREAKAAAKRKREEEVAAENTVREEKRRKLAEESRKRREEQEAEEERARRKRLGLPELKKKPEEEEEEGDKGDVDGEDVPEAELVEKLRALGEPAALFGESHAARLRRHKRLTMVLSKGPIPTTLELVEEKDMKVDGSVPDDKEGRKWLFRQLASYFTMVLTEYEKAMAAEERQTSTSKQAYAAMFQTIESMKPVS